MDRNIQQINLELDRLLADAANLRDDKNITSDALVNDPDPNETYYDNDLRALMVHNGEEWIRVGPWDGHTELPYEAYTDLVISPANMKITGGNAPTELPWLTDLLAYSFADGEYLHIDGVQSPHGCKDGTDWLWHVHFCPNATELADGETVIWRLTYSVVKPFALFPATTTVDVTYTNDSTARANLAAADLNGTNIRQNVHLIAGSTAIDGSDFTASTVLAGKLERLAADTYTGEAILVSSDFHIQINRLGTENEYTG